MLFYSTYIHMQRGKNDAMGLKLSLFCFYPCQAQFCDNDLYTVDSRYLDIAYLE